MTEKEICSMYRGAKDKRKQIQIISDMKRTSKVEIIMILMKNGEDVSEKEIEQLFKRLDVLDRQIVEREREYRAIVDSLHRAVGIAGHGA